MESNRKLRTIVANISYTFISNTVSLLVSLIMILLVPKVLSVEEYGQWQLYLFYTSYVGFLHMGLCDGIYLRYGGKKYENIDKKIFGAMFWVLVVYIFSLSLLFFQISKISITDNIKQIVITFTCLSAMIQLPKTFLSMVLQATNRIKEYALFTLIDRGSFCVFVILLLSNSVEKMQIYMFLDIVAKFASLIGLMICCRDMVFSVSGERKKICLELGSNIKAGSSLLLGNIASLLIIGIVRFAIELTWDIETFSKVSLALSITNFILSFINMVAIVLFPILKTLNQDKLATLYKQIRTLLVSTVVIVLNLYFPIKEILGIWLPQYIDSLSYLSVLFPLCLFEAKYAVLVNTYLKNLRKEKIIFKVNVISVCVSLVCTFITVVVFKNLQLAIISIVLLGAIKCSIAERYLARYIGIKILNNIIKEVGMSIVFIIANCYIGSGKGFILYLVVSLLYVFFERKKLKETYSYIKNNL